MTGCLYKNNCSMENKQSVAIWLLETVAFSARVSGTQAHSDGFMNRLEDVGWSLLRAKAHLSLSYRSTAHGIDGNSIPQGGPYGK